MGGNPSTKPHLIKIGISAKNMNDTAVNWFNDASKPQALHMMHVGHLLVMQ